jgi:dTDP-4-dehydrorhamnose 3,5-epimerase
MIFQETALAGAYIVELKKFEDERGFFARAWCQAEFGELGLVRQFVQANQAYTRKRGTVRGLHYQAEPHSEAKLMRCIQGAIFDVIVDLRPDSPTFKQWLGVELSAQNRRALYIPEGCAHGYQALQDDSEVFYLVSQPYAAQAERGVRWDDPAFAIDWPITASVIISEKDQNWARFEG